MNICASLTLVIAGLTLVIAGLTLVIAGLTLVIADLTRNLLRLEKITGQAQRFYVDDLNLANCCPFEAANCCSFEIGMLLTGRKVYRIMVINVIYIRF